MAFNNDEIKFSEIEQLVTLKLTASKTDPSAKGIRRTLACDCDGSGDSPSFWCCPYHVTKELVHHQERRLGTKLGDAYVPDAPLIGTVGDPFQFVTKEAMIAALRRDIVHMKQINLVDPLVDETAFTGHSMRRGGVKYLARLGIPLDLIMHLSRHSSSAVHGYIEEAYEESPIEQRKFVAHATLQKQVNELAGNQHTCNEILKQLSLEVAVQAHNMGQPLDESTLEKIARRVLHPEVVMNLDILDTKKVHSTSGCTFLESPLRWTTRCGWRWVGADAPVKFINDLDGLPSNHSAFDKCMHHMPDWFNRDLELSDNGRS